SATPSTDSVNTARAANVPTGQGAPSAAGVINRVTASPGRVNGTICRVTTPPNPTAANAVVRVISRTASTLVAGTSPVSSSGGCGGQHRPARRADRRGGQVPAVGGPVGSGPQQLGQYGQEHRRRRVHPGGLGGRQTGQRGAGGRDGHPDRDVPRVGQAHRSTP